jgi:hypothetical protein
MAIIFKTRPASPATPLAALIEAVSVQSIAKVAPLKPTDYNILDALKELSDGRKGHLYLRKDGTDIRYEVLHYDPATCQAKLKNPEGGSLTPVIGMREAVIYSPEWR